MSQSPYVKSNYPRVPGDYYPTIDPRCVYALLQCNNLLQKTATIFDVCAPQGSGIIKTLKEAGYENSFCRADAFDEVFAEWIVTNPPFSLPLVDQIIERQIERVHHNHVSGFACLLRANFDFAKSRQRFFKDEPFYYGKIQMLFRPRWFEKKKGDAGPTHNYVWHIWSKHIRAYPRVMYADGSAPK